MYSEVISINEQFKNSVNVEYDLMNYNKIAEYIPTEDICEVLHYYFNSVQDSKYNRATILEGPYGKGKSYLVLALTQLLSLDLENPELKLFLKKLKNIDINLYDQFIELKKDNFKLLPIVINSNYSHLQQALNIALKDALSRVGLDNIYPNTAYEVCLSVINQWEKDETIYKKVKKNCLTKVNDTLENIKLGLKNYDSSAFEKFTQLYNCVVNGLEFNPFVNDDVIKNYKDIAYKLNEYGYNGIFVVFDEFSKFIDADIDGLTNELKVLQDLAEVVSRSGKNDQMHLCCITHKSLESYYRNKKEAIANAIRTVEGRFKEIRFNRSLNQNYEIISFAIGKKQNFNKIYNKFEDKNKQFYSDITSLELFDDVNSEILCKGCFPLNPLTTYSAINISEKIAQNERTLFTFISDSDSSSLASYIKNNNDGLMNVDKIYDYFSPLIEKSEDEEIRRLHYKITSNLSKIENDLEKRIIKVIAVIKIINNRSFIANIQTITYCVNANIKEVLLSLESLMELKLLKKSAFTETYDFTGASCKEIDAQVDSFISTKCKLINLASYLNEIYPSNFVLPRRYNANFKMTRYYREKYLLDIEFLKLKSFKPFNDHEFCDGFIFRIINTGVSAKDIKEHFEEMTAKETVILKTTKDSLSASMIQEIYKIMGLKDIISKNKVDDITRNETEGMLADEISELGNYLNELYQYSNVECISEVKEYTYNNLLSKVMENVYSKTPIINNEMINKEFNVSSNYVKARNVVVDLYLKKKIELNQENLENYSIASAENTVYVTSKDRDSKEKREVLEIIKDYFIHAENKKISASSLISILSSKPYGIRSGVMPLYIAMAINEMDINIISYFETREINLDAENINKIVSNSEKYYFYTEKGSKEKTDYLNRLLDIFKLETTNSYRNDIKIVVDAIQKWMMSMPRILRNVSSKDNYLNVDSKFIELRTIFVAFNINEYDAIFNKMPKIFDSKYHDVIKNIEKYRKENEIIINDFSMSLANKVKILFDSNEDSSLYNAIEKWISSSKAKEKLLEDTEKSFITLFNQKNYDDILLINEISRNIVNVQITDWERNQTDLILESLSKIKENIENSILLDKVIKEHNEDLHSNEAIVLSPIAKMISNNIEEALEEFGDSVTKEEKINILKNLIDQMI